MTVLLTIWPDVPPGEFDGLDDAMLWAGKIDIDNRGVLLFEGRSAGVLRLRMVPKSEVPA